MITDYTPWIILGIITIGNFCLAWVCISYAKLAQEACRKSLGITHEGKPE